MENKTKRFLKRFAPTFEESSLFTMGVTFIALFCVDSELRGQIVGFVLVKNSSLLIALALYFLGLMLSVFHVFSDKKKSELEKQALLTFAIATNAISGLFSGSFAMANSSGFFSVFAFLCVLNACLLVVFCMHEVIDLSNISDDNVTGVIEQ